MGGEKNQVRVGAAALVRRGDGKILMGKRSVWPRGMWVFPGGGVHFGERAEQAVVRELREETGLKIKPTKLITVYEMLVLKRNVHRVIFFYMARVVGGKEKPSEDIDEIRWLTPKEITQMENIGDSTIDILKAAGLLKGGGK